MTTQRTWIRGGLQRVTRDGRGRWYTWDGERYWSVTTIINAGLPKPALINWAKRFTAEYAVDKYQSLGVILEDSGRAGAVDWLKDASYRDMKKKGDLGSLVHDYAEAHVLGTPLPPAPDDATPYLVQFVKFLDDYQPTYEAVEAPVISREQRWAGTLDAIMTIDRDLFDDAALRIFESYHDRAVTLLVDYKTGKGIWPEVALQLAGYRYADTFLGGPDTSETTMPQVDGCAVLHLRTDGYDLIPIRVGDDAFAALQYAREMHRWTLEGSTDAVGAPNVLPPLPSVIGNVSVTTEVGAEVEIGAVLPRQEE